MSVEMIKTKINGEFELLLPKHRADRPEWHTEQGWEKKRLHHMSQHIGSGDIVVYVGAEEGEMPALCQMWGAKVVLVEPNELVWPNIKAIWDANELPPPLEIFVGFCSDHTTDNAKTGRFGMYDGDKPVDNWPPPAHGEVIGDHGFKELTDPANIPQIKIDNIPVIPTVISIDVEGSEWHVLKGALETLKRHHPKIYLSGHPEFMQHHYGTHLGDLRAWIKNLGYEETLLDYNHEVHLFYEAKS